MKPLERVRATVANFERANPAFADDAYFQDVAPMVIGLVAVRILRRERGGT